MSTLGMSYGDILDYFDKEVSKIIKETEKDDKLYVIYSAYELNEFDIPIDNLKQIPTKGKIRFVSEDGEWKSEIFESPTWVEIAAIANKMIIETQDYFHSYFEDFDVFDTEDDVLIAKLIMGS